MANEAKEKTVLAPSVGPDERQSFPLSSDNSIATSDSEINDQIEKNRRKFGKNISKDSAHERSGISANSHYAGTVRKSISEQTARHRRSALLRHLSLFRCVQRSASPSLWRSLPIISAQAKKLWDYEVHLGTVLYLALEDDYQRLQERMFRMFGVDRTDKLLCSVCKAARQWAGRTVGAFCQRASRHKAYYH